MVREVKNTDLLSIARTVLRDEVLNVVPEHKKYEALMVANAMAIAAREAVYGSLAEPSKAFLTSLLLVSGETDEPIENPVTTDESMNATHPPIRGRSVGTQ